MNKTRRLLGLMTAVMLLLPVSAFAELTREGLSEYKLDNGLTVMLWEDHDEPDVTGYVVVRAGSLDEPAEYTGLAHYLEHMLFKGTQRIGALDWEAEKPIYDSIVALYDQYSDATDPAVREELAKQINEASIREMKLATQEEFWNLADIIGAEGVNAYTSYDLTAYLSSFPEAEMFRWLSLYSDRLINPVFRAFQAELENVFEEYNMYANEPSSQVQNKLFEDIYQGCPYEREVIGLPEHLKNPRLSKLIEFYNTWYVPNNMALILVGDFDSEAAKPLIEKTFSRLEPKELPERPTYPEAQLTGKKHYKLGYNPQIAWVYPGVKVGHEDDLAVEFVCQLLYNGSTGLLDKLNIDGEVQFAGAFCDSRRNTGRIIIEAVPYYDANQQQFESDAKTEKIIMKEVDKIKNGEITDKMIENVKHMNQQSFNMINESGQYKMQLLVNAFTYGLPYDYVFAQNERLQSLTKDEIVRVAKKYFGADHMTLSFDEGDNTKNNKTLPKPNIKPLEPIKNANVPYTQEFKNMPRGELKQTFNNFADVKVSSLGENIAFFYTPNNKNNIFTLTLRYGVGEHEMPLLPYVASMMNNAGIAGDPKAKEGKDFTQLMAELGADISYACDDSYFYISISGEDENMAKIMNLVNRQVLMPSLEQKQLDNVKGSVFYSRYSRAKRTAEQKSALLNYAIYGKQSEYLEDEVPFADIWGLTLPRIQSLVAQARTYALDIFYCGALPENEVTSQLPLTEGMKPSQSPFIKERVSYDKPTVLFLPNSSVQQADLYFYINGSPYDIASDVVNDAFNQYFSGGFTGLVMNEIRNNRSMAYTAYGNYARPIRQGKDCYFFGYVGTQSDKVNDAIDVYMDLLQNMPVDSTNLEPLRSALRQAGQSAKPSMRGKARTFQLWQQMGYNDDPAKINAKHIEELTFSEIEQFYKDHIQGKPVTIILMGDPKKIDLKAIEKRLGCKVTKLSTGRLFNPTSDLLDAIM